MDFLVEYGVVDRNSARARRIGALPAPLNPVVQSRSTIVPLSRPESGMNVAAASRQLVKN